MVRWFARFDCSLFVLLNFSSEMIAVPLASQSSLNIFNLKGYALCRRRFWLLGLPHGGPDAAILIRKPCADFGTLKSITNYYFLRSRLGFLQIFGGFWCPWVVSFGMLGASTLFTILGDPGTILGH